MKPLIYLLLFIPSIAFSWGPLDIFEDDNEISIKQANEEGCKPEHPLHIKITNNHSSKPIEATWFTIVVKRRGYSSDLVDAAKLYTKSTRGGMAMTDKVIPPGGAYDECWAIPLLTESHPIDELEFTITNISYNQ